MASLHALGALAPGEASSFEAHLSGGCPVCAAELLAFQEALGELGKASASAAPPPPGLRDRLLRRIANAGAVPEARRAEKQEEEIQVWKKWSEASSAEPARSLHIVRSGEGGFEPTASPGVFAKPLHVDRARRYVTMLVRMEPGSSYPGHHHAGAEECYVLSGDLRVGEAVLRGGDYQCAGAGSEHEVQSTEGGCMLLIISSQDDELS